MKEINPRLLQKYFRGQCSPEEAEQVLNWFSTPEGEQYLTSQVTTEFEQLSRSDVLLPESPDAHQMLDRIRQHMADGETISTRTVAWWRRRWVAAAASVALLLVCLGYWLLTPGNTVRYQTGYGEIRTITLPDQSVVTLNAHSTLRFNRNWQEQASREVWLEGEAFFKVSKRRQQNRPVKFTVHSGKVGVEVLGTQFNVANHHQTTQVVLNEGRIKLVLPEKTTREKSLIMKPGEMVVYQDDKQAVTRRIVNAHIYNSWTDRKWILENTTLQQIARRIENTYGIRVKIADQRLAGEPMTGVLPTADLTKLLQVLSATYGVQVQRDENQLILYK